MRFAPELNLGVHSSESEPPRWQCSTPLSAVSFGQSWGVACVGYKCAAKLASELALAQTQIVKCLPSIQTIVLGNN